VMAIAQHPQGGSKLHVLLEERLEGAFGLLRRVRDRTPQTQRQVFTSLYLPAIPTIGLLIRPHPLVHILRSRAQNDALHPKLGHKIKRPRCPAHDGLTDFDRLVERTWYQHDLLELIPTVGDLGWDGVMRTMMRERLGVQSLQNDLELLFKQVPVRCLVQHRRAKSLHLACMIAPPKTTNHPPVGEHVRHSEILGETERMPHGEDI